MDENQQATRLLARLDRLPVWPYSYWIIVVIGIGFFFSYFDVVTIGMALPVIAQQFQINVSAALWAITSSLLGYIVGSFIDSRLSDLFGRRLALIVSMMLFSLGSLLSATSPSLTWLVIWRFIIGMGIGAEIANVTTYIGELSPAACRGKISSITVSLGFIGFAIVPFISLALIPHFSWGWRALFACGGLGSVLVLFARRYIPDSIRWTITQHRYEEAERQLLKAEQLAAKRYGRTLPSPQAILPIKASSTTSLLNLLQRPYLYKVLFFTLIWFIYYLGNYGWLTLNTKLFLLEGFDLTNSLLLVAVSSLGFVLGSCIAIFLSDKLERKFTISMAAFVWTVCLAFIAWLPSISVILIFGCIGTTTIAVLIPLLYIFTAENFPTSCRATGVSITDGIGHLGGAFCGQIILGIYTIFNMTHYGIAAAFSTMALTGLLTAILVLFGSKMTREVLHQ